MKVLIVEDNRDAAEALSQSLESMGFEIRIAHEAYEALSVARDFNPDAALLDIGLPVMDGYELARRLREERRGIRIIAVTGYGQADDRRRAVEAGFDGHLLKPVDLDQLGEMLSRVGVTFSV